MKFPDDLAQRPAEEAARRIALAHLEAAAEAFARLDEPSDTEALHDYRVGLRRLRSALRAYEPFLKGCAPRRTRRRVRDLAAGTGPSRDLEVQGEWLDRLETGGAGRLRTGILALRARLARHKAEADDSWRASAHKDFPKLRRFIRRRYSVYQIRVRPDRPSLLAPAGHAVAERLHAGARDLRGRFAEADVFSDSDRAHSTRIALKGLRYLLEPYAPSLEGGGDAVADLRDFQDALGELNDYRRIGGDIASALYEAADAGGTEAQSGAGLSAAPGALPGAGPRGMEPTALEGLLALVAEWRILRDEALRATKARWDEGARERLLVAIGQLAGQLEAQPGERPEAERKYLLNGLPPGLEGAEFTEIQQGWLPGTRFPERFRRMRTNGEVHCYRTIKWGSGLRRMELEEEIPAGLFQSVWPLTAGHRVLKKRYHRGEDGLTWEVDVFSDRELVLAEVELPSPDAAVEPPEWLAPFIVREVSDDPEFLGPGLAK